MTVEAKLVEGVRSSEGSGLEQHGIRHINAAFWNLNTAELLEHAIERREGANGFRCAGVSPSFRS